VLIVLLELKKVLRSQLHVDNLELTLLANF
jgi:hypothetical protein